MLHWICHTDHNVIFLIDLEIVTKFAQMMFIHGEPDRGSTLFEETVISYPKRPNVWSMYLDALIKAQQYEKAR